MATRATARPFDLAAQPSLFGGGAPAIDDTFRGLTRRVLDQGAWVDHQPGWLQGHDELFTTLLDLLHWSRHRRTMYDRVVEVPRLLGSLPQETETDTQVGAGGDLAVLAVLGEMARVLGCRYGTVFERVGFALYRNGRDSVAWHGDQVARNLHQAVVATVSLGATRTFALRPKGGGPAVHYRLGGGDLLIMGGTCQRTWDHSIPKVASAGPRIAVMFRPAWAAWSDRLH